MQLRDATAQALKDIGVFSKLILNRPLRPYQAEAAAAIAASVIGRQGLTFVVEMSRQAGKNELSAILESYLLTLYSLAGGQIVKASPTFKPQTLNSIQRLTDRLKTPWHIGRVKKRSGYIVEFGDARAMFFSADPKSSVVGATASLLLEADEAQDIRAGKWDKDFEPMRASTNATIVMWGTAWTTNTLLYLVRQACERAQNKDGKRRVFVYPCDEVARCVPAYAAHVRDRVDRLGREHPLIKTQYFLEEIDAAGGLFSEASKALMHGTHPRTRQPEPGHVYGILIDVAGEDEEAAGTLADLDRDELGNKRRDATQLTVVDITQGHGVLQPTYLVCDRRFFLGTRHTALYEQINGIVAHWAARWIVVDATGVGAGLCSFLAAKWNPRNSTGAGDRVIPFEFSGTTKSDLGWDFLGIVNTGRFRDHADDNSCEYRQFWYEVDHCEKKLQDGPAHRLSWGVWENPAYDGLIARGHDDSLIAAAFVAVLDKQPRPEEYAPAQVQTEPEEFITKRREGKF
jgi:hypothetical protein